MTPPVRGWGGKGGLNLLTLFFQLPRPFRSSSIAKHRFLLHNFLLFLLLPTHLKLPPPIPFSPTLYPSCTMYLFCPMQPSFPTYPSCTTYLSYPTYPSCTTYLFCPALLFCPTYSSCTTYLFCPALLLPLLKGHFFWVPKPAGFNLHFRRHLKTRKVTVMTTKKGRYL